jgi:hypothetical protein
MLLEELAELCGIDLWVHAGGNPEEVEGVIAGGLRLGKVLMRVRVGRAVVVVVPIVCGGGLCGLRGQIWVDDGGLSGGPAPNVAQVFDLALDLVLGRLQLRRERPWPDGRHRGAGWERRGDVVVAESVQLAKPRPFSPTGATIFSPSDHRHLLISFSLSLIFVYIYSPFPTLTPYYNHL